MHVPAFAVKKRNDVQASKEFSERHTYNASRGNMNSSAVTVLNKGGEPFAKVGCPIVNVPVREVEGRGIWGRRRQKIFEFYICANKFLAFFYAYRKPELLWP